MSEQQNINHTIENAAKTQTDQDYQSFFNTARGTELFFNVIEANSSEHNDIKVPTVSVGDNINAIVFYTSPDDERLGERYAGIVWEKGLEMAYRMSNVNGLVIQSSSEYWIAITREKIEEIINQY